MVVPISFRFRYWLLRAAAAGRRAKKSSECWQDTEKSINNVIHNSRTTPTLRATRQQSARASHATRGGNNRTLDSSQMCPPAPTPPHKARAMRRGMKEKSARPVHTCARCGEMRAQLKARLWACRGHAVSCVAEHKNERRHEMIAYRSHDQSEEGGGEREAAWRRRVLQTLRHLRGELAHHSGEYGHGQHRPKPKREQVREGNRPRGHRESRHHAEQVSGAGAAVKNASPESGG